MYKVALVPLGNYVFFLAQFTTFGSPKQSKEVRRERASFRSSIVPKKAQ